MLALTATTAYAAPFFSLLADGPATTTLYKDSFTGAAAADLHRRAPDTVAADSEVWSAEGFALDGSGVLQGTTAVATLPLYPYIQRGDTITITVMTDALGGVGENGFGIGFTSATAKIINTNALLNAWALIHGHGSAAPGSVNSYTRGTESAKNGTAAGFNPMAFNTLRIELNTGSGSLSYRVNGRNVIVRNDISVDEIHDFDQAVLYNYAGDLSRIAEIRIDVLRPRAGMADHDEFLKPAGGWLDGTVPDQVAFGVDAWQSDGFKFLSPGDRITPPNSSNRATLPMGKLFKIGDKIRIRAEVAKLGGTTENWLGIGLSDTAIPEVPDMKAWALIRGLGNTTYGAISAFAESTSSKATAQANGFDPEATHTLELTYDSSSGRQTFSVDGETPLIDRVITQFSPSTLNHAVLFSSSATLTEITSFKVEIQPARSDFESSKIFHATDYGAIGDGSTDDGPALRSAVAAIKTYGSSATLEFESGKTYRITSGASIASYDWGMDLNGMTNLVIDGNGATLMPASPVNVFRVVNAGNITIRDLTIDFYPLPFVVGEIINVNAAEYHFDLDILPSYEMTPLDAPGNPNAENMAIWNFGIPVESAGRHHIGIDSVQQRPGSTDPRQVRVYVDDEFTLVSQADTDIRMGVLANNSDHFWLPYRNVGHQKGFAAHIGNSGDIKFENINIYSIPAFVFSVKGNQGPITFNAVHTVPKPGRELAMCSWRDVYHCRQNRGPIHITHCTGSRSHDDTINLSAQYLVVQGVSNSVFKINKQEVPIQVGDQLTALDLYNGLDLGNFTLTSISDTTEGNTIKTIMLDRALDLSATAVTNLRFQDEDASCEFSRVENCTFQGSFRFRSTVSLADTYIFGPTTIQNGYGDANGGPLPHNQYYVDSVFEANLPTATAITITAQNRGTNASVYRPENIIFDTCSVTGVVNILEGSGVTGL